MHQYKSDKYKRSNLMYLLLYIDASLIYKEYTSYISLALLKFIVTTEIFSLIFFQLSIYTTTFHNPQ